MSGSGPVWPGAGGVTKPDGPCPTHGGGALACGMRRKNASRAVFINTRIDARRWWNSFGEIARFAAWECSSASSVAASW